MRRLEAFLTERLADERGREVVFASHCLLDENVRYLGGAFHRGAVPELVDLLAGGVGVSQMPCPEQRAWGGVLKRRMLLAYGLRDTPLWPLRRILLRLFVWHTRARYRSLARHVARDIEDYRAAGVRVLAVIGVGASPSCGACTTLDLRRSFEAIATCPLAQLDRATFNQRAILACRTDGEGLFIAALDRRLARRRIDVPFLEYDLVAEMQGADQPPALRSFLSERAGARSRAPAATGASARASRPRRAAARARG